MGIELDVASFVAFVIDLSQGTTSVPDIDSLPGGVVAKVVGVIAIFKGLESCIRTSIKYPNASVLPVGHEEPIRSGYVKNTLRLLHTADRL